MATSNKNFKVKNGLEVGAFTVAGYVSNDASGVLSSVTQIPNTGILYPYITINGTQVNLGGSITVAGGGGGSGTVTSVDMTVPIGLAISGNPITTSGTLAITFASGYSIPTTTNQTNWTTAYGWGNHATQGYIKLTSLSATGPVLYNNTTGVISLGTIDGGAP